MEGRDAILEILAPLLAADRERRKGQPLSLQAKDLQVQQRGDVALATFDVGAATVRSRRTLVLERRGWRWLIVHLHASNLSVPQSSLPAEDLYAISVDSHFPSSSGHGRARGPSDAHRQHR